MELNILQVACCTHPSWIFLIMHPGIQPPGNELKMKLSTITWSITQHAQSFNDNVNAMGDGSHSHILVNEIVTFYMNTMKTGVCMWWEWRKKKHFTWVNPDNEVIGSDAPVSVRFHRYTEEEENFHWRKWTEITRFNSVHARMWFQARRTRHVIRVGCPHTYTVSGPSIWTTYDPPCVIIG